jgi:hypothetical protein
MSFLSSEWMVDTILMTLGVWVGVTIDRDDATTSVGLREVHYHMSACIRTLNVSVSHDRHQFHLLNLSTTTAGSTSVNITTSSLTIVVVQSLYLFLEMPTFLDIVEV